MTLRIEVAVLAQRDMHALIAHIGQDDPKAAIQVAERIIDRMAMLVAHPWIGRPGRRDNSRELVVEGTSYIVAYRVDMKRQLIWILRIMHHAQRWPEKL